MKDIKLTKKESDLKNLKKAGIKPKTKRIKAFVFHPEFDKGIRLCLCLNCGYPVMFQGLWDYSCDTCGAKKIKIYHINKLQDFILRLQKSMVKYIKTGRGVKGWKPNKKSA